MTDASGSHQGGTPESGAFTKAFVPGLVLGLVIGLFGGVISSEFLGSSQPEFEAGAGGASAPTGDGGRDPMPSAPEDSGEEIGEESAADGSAETETETDGADPMADESTDDANPASQDD